MTEQVNEYTLAYDAQQAAFTVREGMTKILNELGREPLREAKVPSVEAYEEYKKATRLFEKRLMDLATNTGNMRLLAAMSLSPEELSLTEKNETEVDQEGLKGFHFEPNSLKKGQE